MKWTLGPMVATLLLLACQTTRPSDPPTEAPPALSASPAMPARSSAPSAGERMLQAIDVTCATDADCATFDDVLTGETACCPGCTEQVASKRSLDAFRAACRKTPALMCPPLGCLMAQIEVKCVAGSCVSKPVH